MSFRRYFNSSGYVTIATMPKMAAWNLGRKAKKKKKVILLIRKKKS